MNKIQFNKVLPKINKYHSEDDEYEVIGCFDTSTTRRLINGDVVIDVKTILNIIQKIEKINNE